LNIQQAQAGGVPASGLRHDSHHTRQGVQIAGKAATMVASRRSGILDARERS
jgi:hypothetical protein